MNNEKGLSQINEKISLAKEYKHLISLPKLSQEEGERMVEILEIANSDEELFHYIEKVEMEDYLELEKIERGINKEEEGHQHLLDIILTDSEVDIFADDLSIKSKADSHTKRGLRRRKHYIRDAESRMNISQKKKLARTKGIVKKEEYINSNQKYSRFCLDIVKFLFIFTNFLQIKLACKVRQVRQKIHLSRQTKRRIPMNNDDPHGSIHLLESSDRIIAACIDIKQAYFRILKRSPDLSGYFNYLKLMILDNWTIWQVERSLQTSQEYEERIVKS